MRRRQEFAAHAHKSLLRAARRLLRTIDQRVDAGEYDVPWREATMLRKALHSALWKCNGDVE